ncbi:Alpha-1,3-arabinosyltransferase XAT2 [Thalictrum thalictroides]|uniref:Alpha-1,3-arabinosyltransferase XAT2 n=1 Tax=Thalictrum thalictroides TaxID=46969 RepID=A0A7J6VTB7_THATH|nr:Alpha-1,3-arabinosyltransferase XAT2 [Thalictrum thalictroides]
MEYNTIFAKSFSRYEQKKFGITAFLGSLIILLSIFTVFKPSFHRLPILNLRVSMHAGLAMLMFEDSSSPPQQGDIIKPDIATDVIKQEIAEDVIKQEVLGGGLKQETAKDVMKQEVAEDIIKQNIAKDASKQEVSEDVLEQEPAKDVIKQEVAEDVPKPVCNVFEPRSDFCNIDRNIRIHGNSSTIYFTSSQMGIVAGNETWRIRPYARKGDNTAMGAVSELSVRKIIDNQVTPSCTINHKVPAIVFSTGGYAGNHFHDFADVLVPLFVTARQFDGEVQFLVTNVKSFWLHKYKVILEALSRYEIIDMNKGNEVHCFPSGIVGLFQTHTELRIDPSKSPKGYSMTDFRQFLRSSYSLKKNKAIRLRRDSRDKKPRLLIVSRKRTRSFTNEDEIVKMAKTLGFTVVVAEPGMTGLSEFAQIVNSCDVMMGVHGAGLTNLVFLPTNAILIQIVPWGRLEWISTQYFGEPAVGMNLKYLEYTIRKEESSLIQQYPIEHAVFKDPLSIHKQGWEALKSIYLEKQNVKLDVNRFKGTLLKALKLLHH